jgi:hypothetical protein
MKRLLVVALIAFAAAFAGNWLSNTVHAQTTVALQLTGNAPHATCTVTTGQTTYCFASDGLWQSLNGAAYVQLGVAPPAGVISVNGKTGIVVLSATTTSTATTTIN